MTVRSSSVSAPVMCSLICFPTSFETERTIRGKRLNTCSIGIIRNVKTSDCNSFVPRLIRSTVSVNSGELTSAAIRSKRPRSMMNSSNRFIKRSIRSRLTRIVFEATGTDRSVCSGDSGEAVGAGTDVATGISCGRVDVATSASGVASNTSIVTVATSETEATAS